MNLEKFFSEESQLWPTFATQGTNVIETTTTYSQGDAVPTTIHNTISSKQLESWLADDHEAIRHDRHDSISFRAVWVYHDPVAKVNHISNADLTTIVESFGLDGVQELCATAIWGAEVVRLPSRVRKQSLQRFCFRSHPKIMVLWSHDPEIGQTSALCFAGKEQIQKLRKLISLEWKASKMLLPFICATLFSAEIDKTQEATKHEIRAIEARTGYHRWISHSELPATGDLSSLSATMSGLAAKMAAAARKGKVIEQLIDFVEQHHLIEGQPLDQQIVNGLHKHHRDEAIYLRQRTHMQKVDTDFIQRRIDIQMSALLGLIAQYDALASHRTAHESKIIAMASQRDSSSMKTLAAVTILYLPGQVVASIFEMPLFNWTAGQAESPDRVVNSRFYIYWAVTIPLTVFTFFLAIVWLVFEKRHRWKKASHIDDNNSEQDYQIPEVKALTRSRSTGLPSPTEPIHIEGLKIS